MIRLSLSLAAAVAVAAPLAAWAQTPTTPGGSLGPPPGGTIGEEEPKKQGVAEKAPKEQAQLPTLPPLPPYPGQDRKKFELVELDGYFRFRSNWFDNFNLGFVDQGNGAPFSHSLACRDTSTDPGIQPANAAGCGGSVSMTNLRARLEPTINLSEYVSLHLQIDALDNVILGSTPSGVFLDTGVGSSPTESMTTSQTSPQADKNSPWDSIRVKRAWAEVKTPLGALRFGRMPSHWGMGIYSHSGGYDPIHDTYCLDCDDGDNVDRFIFGTTIPGTNIRAAVGYDWNATGPTAGQTSVWRSRDDGQPFDLDDTDDVTEYVVILGRFDDPETWRATLRDGRTGLNYGAQFFWRRQSWEVENVGGPLTDAVFVNRDANMYIPDVWVRLTAGKLSFEAEAVGVFGNINNIVDPLGPPMTFLELGAVARMSYLMLDDDLEISLEGGFASGDEWEDENSGTLHIDEANYLPRAAADTTISHFAFNRNYRVDLILWKELYGAVTNALYIKPRVRYNITERFFFSAASIGSFAARSVATPANQTMYGIELDGEVGYANVNEGFFAGLYYGVLFPLAALDHPIDLFPNELGQGASTAQTFQIRLALKF